MPHVLIAYAMFIIHRVILSVVHCVLQCIMYIILCSIQHVTCALCFYALLQECISRTPHAW